MEDGQLLFKGLKVIDCASYIAGPAAGTIMSDFGADVIRIEPPAGDLYRYFIPQGSFPYDFDSRNKRSVALDLKSEKGRDALLRLVKDADVYITNQLPSIRKRLRLEYEDLKAINPKLIFASITAYGEAGPEGDKSGFDATAFWARSGLMDMVRADRDYVPSSSTPGQGDHPTAVALYGAIVTALYRRTMTGKGGYVKTSLLANGLYANGCMLQGRFENIDFEGLFPAPPRPERSMPLANIYRAGCGRWLFLAILNDRQLGPLCEALGCPEVAADPKFSTDAARRENNKEMIAFLDAKFATKDRDHWNAALNKAGVTFTTIATMDDVYNDEQAKAAGLVVKFEDGGSWTVNSPFEVDGQKKVTPKRVAAVGQHTREVLKEAGYSEKEIEDMVSSGAVAVKAKL